MRIFICLILFSKLFLSSSLGCAKKIVPEASSVSLIPGKSTMELFIGEAQQIFVRTSPALANKPILSWSSSDSAIATVENGLIIAHETGKARILVQHGKGSISEIMVEVKAILGDTNHAVLFDSPLSTRNMPAEIITNSSAFYTLEGLKVTGYDKLAKVDIFYAIARRKVQYIANFSADARAVFSSSQGDFNAYIDLQKKSISIGTNPITETSADFLEPDRDYIVEIIHDYQKAKLKITDRINGKTAEVKAVHDGQGGVGKGALQKGFPVGMQWDHYCFGLKEGSYIFIKKITVYALQNKVKLLIYGDSITQPEGYFPSKYFNQAWTQQLIRSLNGNAVSSGRGGATIDMILEYIKNEIPFIDAEYVMVTIGTNGGNTAQKLSELVEYIHAQGAIPLLNNIPSNESSTQLAVNATIDSVRRKFGINGARFDLATSIGYDGKQVDKSTMYWEDYSESYGWQIYHHPNEIGGDKMFRQILKDIPELFR